ncbi:HD domain-containing protein [Planctomycetota bacterium]
MSRLSQAGTRHLRFRHLTSGDKQLITTQQFTTYRTWFDTTLARFKELHPNDLAKIELKEHHALRVCREIVDLAESEELSDDYVRLAKTAALLHDVGRIEQYAEHGEVLDLHSEDHAQLGIALLRRENVLNDLDADTRDLICRVISYHNRAGLPENETERCLLFTKLLRDADKLDILEIMIHYYEHPEDSVEELITLRLNNTPEVSPEVIADLESRSIVKAEHLKTSADLKMLQMGWSYDIYFPHTFRQFAEREYLAKILKHVPHPPEVLAVYEALRSYIREKIEDR